MNKLSRLVWLAPVALLIFFTIKSDGRFLTFLINRLFGN
jgi:hypothetical protein